MAIPQKLRDELRRIIVLALPIIGGNLAMMAVGITDTIMVGWHSVEELAALTLASTLFVNILLFGVGLPTALVPLVASAFAVNDTRQVRQTTRMTLWLSVIFGACTLPIFMNAEDLFILIGQDPHIAHIAQQYLTIAGPAIIPILWANVLRSYLSGMELIKFATLMMVSAAVLNALTNYLLIFGHYGFPEMGVRGAALSSVVINFLQAIIISFYAMRKLPEHELFARFYRPNWGAFWQVFRLGMPIGGAMFAEAGSFAGATFMMGWLGVVALAAHGIALQIASVTFMAHLGISQAATIRVGNAYGRKSKADMRDRSIAAGTIGVAWSLMTSTLFVVFGAELIGLFLGQNEPARNEIIAYGVVLLYVAALFQLVDGAQVVAMGVLRGIHDTAVPMLITFVSYWIIGLLGSYVFAFVFGWNGVGLWFGLVLGLGSAAVALCARFVFLYRRISDDDQPTSPAQNAAIRSHA